MFPLLGLIVIGIIGSTIHFFLHTFLELFVSPGLNVELMSVLLFFVAYLLYFLPSLLKGKVAIPFSPKIAIIAGLYSGIHFYMHQIIETGGASEIYLITVLLIPTYVILGLLEDKIPIK